MLGDQHCRWKRIALTNLGKTPFVHKTIINRENYYTVLDRESLLQLAASNSSLRKLCTSYVSRVGRETKKADETGADALELLNARIEELELQLVQLKAQRDELLFQPSTTVESQ
jgi:hypothetical protein